LEVTGGTFFRTYDPAKFDDAGVYMGVALAADGGPTGEAAPATISTFRLDKYEATVGRFRQFVNAWNSGSGWLPAPGSGKHTYLNSGNGLNATGGGYESGWQAADDVNIAPPMANLAGVQGYSTWTNTAGVQENLPINFVNWYEAYAFCIWDGGFLPSEAEWEYAAAGGSEQREYPWGSTDPGASNRYAIYGDWDDRPGPLGVGGNCYYPNGALVPCTGVRNIAPVGITMSGAGLWGQLDLAGNMSERTLDSYVDYVDPCVDCANFLNAAVRVFRGGYFGADTSYLVPSDRVNGGSTARGSGIGLRCARAP
jgi:formylglycine-generating enzyme required for sulfatase activity